MATKKPGDKIREYVNNRTSSSGNSSLQTTKSGSAIKKKSLENRIRFDTFQSDLSSMGKTIEGIYGEWQTQETMNNTRHAISSMNDRINAYQEYRKLYGGDKAPDLSELASGYNEILGLWDEKAKTYGKYKDATSYTNAMKAAEEALKVEESKKTANLDDVQKEIDYLEEILNTAKTHQGNLRGTTNRASTWQHRANGLNKVENQTKNIKSAEAKLNSYLKNVGFNSVEDIEAALSEKKQYKNSAAWVQKGIEMASVGDEFSEYYDKDFEEKSKYVTTKYSNYFGEYNADDTYEYINDVNGERERLIKSGGTNANNIATQMAVGYEYMTEQEKKLYNYYYATGGRKKAEEYLNTIEQSLGTRKSQADFKNFEGNTFKEMLYGVKAGLDQFSTGMKNLFNGDDEYIPVNATQQLSGLIREDLSDDGPEFLGSSLGQGAYDFITTTSNMAPSIATSYLSNAILPGSGAIVGAALMGGSAAGNSYQEKLNLGWDKSQARVYSTVVGVSEGALQYALGGIGSLGGKITGKSAQAIARGIDNAAARFAVTYGMNMASEGIEEGLQEVLTPFFENLALGYAKNDFSDIEWEQVAYSGLLGALSAGFLEGGSTAANVFGENHKAKGIGAEIRSSEQVSDMLDVASLTPQESAAYDLYTRYANKGVNAENVSDLQLGRLYLNAEADARATLSSKKSTLAQQEQAKDTIKKLSGINAEKTLDSNTISGIEENIDVSKQYRDGLISEGLESAENTESHKLALEYQAKVKNGEDISAEELSKLAKANENAIKIEEYAQAMSEEDAGLFVEQYDGTMDVEEYQSNFNYVNVLADNAVDIDEALSKSSMTPSQIGAIYNAKILASDAKPLRVAHDNLKAKYKGSAFIEGSVNDVVIDYRNATTDGSKVNWKSLTSRQRKAIRFAKAFAKATGVNIIFTQSKVVNGKHKGENGSYNPETNTITLDVYAGRIDAATTKDAIIPTLSHELTHWMKYKAPEMYKAISEDVMQTLVASGKETRHERITREMDRLKKAHPEMKVTSEDAIDELVARACEDMLSNSNQARKILSKMSVEEQQSFVDKVKETLDNLIGWVNELLSYYKSETEEAKTLREYKANLKSISKMWDDMLVSAIEANQALQKEGITGEKLAKKVTSNVQYSTREKFDNACDKMETISDKEYKEALKTHPFVLVMDYTPQIVIDAMKEIDPDLTVPANNRRILIKRDALYLAIRGEGIQEGHYHELGAEALKKLPEYLEKPDAIIKTNENQKRCLVLSHIEAKNGQAIISVEFESSKDYEGKNEFFNVIVTVFDLHENYIKKLFIKNNADIKYEKEDLEQVNPQLYKWLRTFNSKSSNDNIAQNNTKSQEKNSNRDNLGNTLSEGQQSYFSDSKVRDENGNLLVMYRGDAENFTVFDRKKTKHSNLYGRGFYFTNSKSHAEQYGEAREFYLDIKNPLSPGQKDITKEQMLKFLKAIENDGEDYDLYNYGEGATAESVLNSVWGKGDFEMLQDINAGAIGDLVAAVELFNEVNGTSYDGIILPTETVTFNSEQAKLTSNKNPTKNKDIQFSMRENVEETKELVAVHNMQVSELERTLDLGGLPMPSIAIIKAKSGHSEYGDVSLVFPKSTIDPKASRNNKVYGGDAWTPVYPTIEYKPNAKVTKKINDKYYSFSKKFGYEESRPLYSYVYEMEDILNRHKGEAGLIADLYEDEKMMQVYLLDAGKNKVETIKKETRTELTDEEVKMRELFIKELGADVVDEVMWDGNGTPMAHRKNYLSKYGDAIRDAYKKLLSEEYHFTDEQVQNVMDSTSSFDLARFMRDAHMYRENGRVTTKTEDDYRATSEAIKEAAGDGYRKWVDSLFKGVEEKSGIRNNTDTFTNSGNRRSWEALHWENNLENVVKVMKSQDNGQTFFGGQAIWSVAAKDYSSVSDIKADSNRLMTMDKEQYDAIKESFGERFNEIAHSMMDKTESNYFIAIDNAMECVVDALRHSKTKSGILNYLKQFKHLTVTETNVDDIVSLVTDISNMPTEYFEAKPKRAVELNEIATAIIPDSTSEDTKARLDDMGIKYLEYESGNEESRLKTLNSLEEVKFSDRDSQGNTLTAEQIEFFKDSKARDKDGNLIVVYHGTYEDFTVFDISKTASANVFGKGNYFTNKKTDAQENYASGDGADVRSKIEALAWAYFEEMGYTEADYESNEFVTEWNDAYDKAEEFYKTGKVMQGYLNIKNPVYAQGSELYDANGDFVSARSAEYLKELGYDGIIDLGVSERFGSFQELDADTVHYVTFDSEQFKSIDNTNPTSNPDIRFSDRQTETVYDKMGETERIQKENEKLKEDVERLRERVKLEGTVTGGRILNPNQLSAAAGHLRNISNSTYSKEALMKQLQELRDIIYKPMWTQEDLMSKCAQIADNLLSEAKPEKMSNDYAKLILRDIRGKRIKLSETQIQEAKNIFGSNYRNSFMGKILIANDGISLDRQWQEWASKYPAFFKADISEADQVSALYDIYDDLRDSSEMIMEYDMEEQRKALEQEVFNICWRISAITTTADKYEAKIKELNYAHRKAMQELRDDRDKRLAELKKDAKARAAELVSKVRDRKDKEIAEVKKLSKERLESYKEKAERKTVVQRITGNALTLNKWLTKNSKDYHIHEAMKGPVVKLLQAIDFSSKRMIEKGVPTQNDVTFNEAFAEVKSMLEGATNMVVGLEELYGHDLAEDINSLSKMAYRLVGDNNYIINAMTLEELQSLDKLVRYIKSVVSKVNEFHTVHHNQGAVNLANEFIGYGERLGNLKKQYGTAGKFLKFRNRTPYYFFKDLGEVGKKIFAAFQDGWDKLAFNSKRVIDFAEETYTAKEVNKWSKETKEFTLPNFDGHNRKFKMSIAQIMALHCVSKQEDAIRHLLSGGMTLKRIDKKGHVIADYENIPLSKHDIDSIIGTLDDRQREVANKLQHFMNTVCSDWGNEISMARFGVKMFGLPDYFPIKVSEATVPTDNTKDIDNASLFRLLNMSFTKSRNEYADGSIEIGDIFDVFAQHASDMAKYNALALPVLDFNKFYSIHGKNTIGKEYGVVQTLKSVFGDEANGYIRRFVRDLNGSQNVSRDVIGNTFFKNAKLASVANNLRVVLLQPTAFYKASAVLDNKYLIKAGAYMKYEPVGMYNRFKKAVEKAEKYCGIVQWKSLGYYDTDISKGLTEKIKHAETFKDKAVEFSMKGAEIADKATFATLWTACEFEIRDTRKDLNVGSKEYYEAVGKRLREVIYATQVVDSTMTRSDMMRSSDRMDKMLTTFGSEPIIAYNMLLDRVSEYNRDKKELGKKEAKKRNFKKTRKVVAAYIVTNAMAALVESAFDAFRDDDDEEMDMAEFMKLYLKNFALDMSIGNKLPIIKDIYSMMQGYSSSRMDTQWLSYVQAAINTKNPATAFKNLLKAFSSVSGYAFYNAYRDIMATLNKLDIFTTEDLEEMFDGFSD